MTSLESKIGGVTVNTCIYNASGCWCTTENDLNDLLECDSGAIISKSSTVEPRDGNEEPRLYKDNSFGSINSMGVPNLGYKFYLDYGFGVKEKPFIQSIIPFSKGDLVTMLESINSQSKGNYLVEVNLSCPNLKNKSIVAYDFYELHSYIDLINITTTDKLVIGLKLPPYYQKKEFDKVSEIISKYPKIKFLTCINSLVNGLMVDPETETTRIRPKEGFGGIGGKYCKPIALANVRNFYKRLGDNVDVIGCGGVESGEDVFEHVLCGASAVQIGTQLVKEGTTVFKRLKEELINIMDKKGYKKITDFKGNLRLK